LAEQPARFAIVVLTLACVAVAHPPPAAAHGRAPTIALDYRVTVTTPPTAAVRAKVIDGDRDLLVSVSPHVELTLKGLLREPFLRFSAAGVFANSGSPTAASARVVDAPTRQTTWVRLTGEHSFRWHEHRLTPPAGLSVGEQARWAIPAVLDGHPYEISGTFVRVARPRSWLWLVIAGALGASIAAVSRAAPRLRGTMPIVLGGISAVAALASLVGFATGDPIAPAPLWLETAVAALLVAGSVAIVRRRPGSARQLVGGLTGAVSIALTIGSLPVLWHGVVISSLPATAVRLAVVSAFVAGAAAGLLSVFADDELATRRGRPCRGRGASRRRRSPRPPPRAGTSGRRSA
jgi:hypothetical protein